MIRTTERAATTCFRQLFIRPPRANAIPGILYPVARLPHKPAAERNPTTAFCARPGVYEFAAKLFPLKKG